MGKILAGFILLISFGVCAQTENSPIWKLEFDSAQFYWKHDIVRSVQFLVAAEKVAVNDLGIYDDNYLTIVSDLGLAYGELKDYAKAEFYLAQNLQIQQELHSIADPHVLLSRANLASVLVRSGRDVQAKKVYLDILEKSRATGDLNSSVLAALGLIQIYEYHEKLDSAGLLIRYALAKIAQAPDFTSQHDIMLAEGRVLRKQKKYQESTNVLMVLQGKLEKSKDEESLFMSSVLELALIDIDLGLYHKAENTLLGQYRILKSMTDPDPELLTEVTTGLGYLYEKIAVYDKGLIYYRESLGRCTSAYGYYSNSCMVLKNNIAGIFLKQGKIKEAIEQYESFFHDFKKSPETVVWWSAVNNLASAYRQDGRYEDALVKFQEVYDHQSKENKLNDDLTATVMNNIAVTYTLMGSFEKAASYLEKVLKIKRGIYGQNSPVLIDITSNLAVAYWMEKQYELALPLFQESLKLAEHQVRYVFPNLTQSEQVEFYRHQKENFERFNTIALHDPSPSMLAQMFNSQLLLKSLTFFTNQKINLQIQQKHDPKLTAVLDLVQTKGVQLNNYYQMPLTDLAALKISLSEVEYEIDSLEKIIHHAGFGMEPTRQFVEWKDIRKALASDESLVEIIRFRKYDALPFIGNSSQVIRIGFTDSVTYAALITTHFSENGPSLVIFKNGHQMETRFLSYFRNTRRFDVDDTISYVQFWKPIEDKLPGVKKIYLTADGVYHQLNLNSIHDRKGNFLLERYDLRLLLNSSQLVSRDKFEKLDFSKITLVGDPAFENGDRLPGTLLEIQGIINILRLDSSKINLFTGTRANESNLKNITSPSILHIATHGFFETDAVYLNDQVRNEFMFHSGLMLSPERRLQRTLTDTDGVITAADVMGLRLSNTDLVVLSACETGLGKIENSEGVYGLQRSFLQAGAKQLVISLWKVEDEMTKNLMIKFYQHLAEGRSCRDSFRLAQSDMSHSVADPGKWGAFVMVGGN